MDQGDFEDIRHRMPFVLTETDLPEYNILYVGQQQEDEVHCFVFDIAPKQIEGKKPMRGASNSSCVSAAHADSRR